MLLIIFVSFSSYKNLTKTKTDKLIDQTRTKFKTFAVSICINMPSANNKKKAVQQQLQRREAEWTVNVDYLEAMIQEKNLKNINLSYESLSLQKLQLDKLCDDLFKYNLIQNDLKEILERSAERILVILKWKKYGKDIWQENLLRTPTVLCLSAKEEQNHSKLAVKIVNPQQPINPLTFDKKHTI